MRTDTQLTSKFVPSNYKHLSLSSNMVYWSCADNDSEFANYFVQKKNSLLGSGGEKSGENIYHHISRNKNQE